MGANGSSPNVPESYAAREFSKYDALGVIGFSLYLAWVFLLMMNPMLHRSGMDVNAVADVVAFFFLGEIVASCVAWLLSSRLMSKGALKGVVAFTTVLAPLPGLGAMPAVASCAMSTRMEFLRKWRAIGRTRSIRGTSAPAALACPTW